MCPGFIDGHFHIESTMLSAPELARAVLPHGTTAIVADPHDIANAMGRRGINYIIEGSPPSKMERFWQRCHSPLRGLCLASLSARWLMDGRS
ncbi:MAG: amidohydrolase family protein [Syntrophales bacterium]